MDVHGSNFTYTWAIDGDRIRTRFGNEGSENIFEGHFSDDGRAHSGQWQWPWRIHRHHDPHRRYLTVRSSERLANDADTAHRTARSARRAGREWQLGALWGATFAVLLQICVDRGPVSGLACDDAFVQSDLRTLVLNDCPTQRGFLLRKQIRKVLEHPQGIGREHQGVLQNLAPIAAELRRLNTDSCGSVVVDRHLIASSDRFDDVSRRLLHERENLEVMTVLGEPLAECLVVRKTCDLARPTLGKSTLNDARLRHSRPPLS